MATSKAIRKYARQNKNAEIDKPKYSVKEKTALLGNAFSNTLGLGGRGSAYVPPRKADTSTLERTPEQIIESPKTDIKKPNVPAFYTDENGNISGLEIGGKTYFGASPDDFKRMAQEYINEKSIPAGTSMVSKERETEAELAQNQTLAEQIGNIAPGQLSPEELKQLSIGSNLVSGLAGVGAGAVGGILGGVIGGSLIGGPIGAGIGAVGGIATSIVRNTAAEASEDVSVSNERVNNALSTITGVIRLRNQGGISAEQALITYNEQLAIIQKERLKMKELTKNSLNEFLSGGAEEMADLDSMFATNGLIDYYNLRMREAIILPNPTAAYASEGAGVY